MPVYILRLGEQGPVVKIGTAKNVVKRIAGLQTSNHERLVLLRAFEGSSAEEHQLHRLFADHRISREFFTFSKAMLGDVGLVEILAPVEAPPPPVIEPEPVSAEDIAKMRKDAFDDGVVFGMKAATLIFRSATVGITPQDLADFRMSRLNGTAPP